VLRRLLYVVVDGLPFAGEFPSPGCEGFKKAIDAYESMSSLGISDDRDYFFREDLTLLLPILIDICFWNGVTVMEKLSNCLVLRHGYLFFIHSLYDALIREL